MRMPSTNKPSTIFKARHVRGSERILTCDEYKCANRENGWMVVLSIPAQQAAVEFIRGGKTNRRFTEKTESEGLATFYFEAGQNCFAEHWGRDPVFDIGRRDGGRLIMYPDGDAFIEDSDRHLRQLKSVIDG